VQEASDLWYLHHLVAALDRRDTQVGRTGEAAIVLAASALRVRALQRIAELERPVVVAAGPRSASGGIV
jgi:hypothetical protein